MDLKPLLGNGRHKEGPSRRARPHGPGRNVRAKALVESTRHEVQMQLEEVEAWTERGTYQRTGTGPGAAKPPSFDGSTSWAVFRRQFETVAEHSCWMPREIATY
jgi:hypothetical protein